MALMQDFKKFAMRGNVIDLAVGVIIGAAFGKIVDSLVNDLIMPLVARIVGKLDFSNLFIQLADAPAGVPQTLADLKKAGVPVFAYGHFITVAVNFLILAFIVFLMVRAITRVIDTNPPPADTPENTLLLRDIRDSLKSKNQ